MGLAPPFGVCFFAADFIGVGDSCWCWVMDGRDATRARVRLSMFAAKAERLPDVGRRGRRKHLVTYVGFLRLARLRRGIAQERLERLARLSAPLLLKLRDPARYGRDHVARSLLRGLFRRLFRRSFLRFRGGPFTAFNDFDVRFRRHDAFTHSL